MTVHVHAYLGNTVSTAQTTVDCTHPQDGGAQTGDHPHRAPHLHPSLLHWDDSQTLQAGSRPAECEDPDQPPALSHGSEVKL